MPRIEITEDAEYEFDDIVNIAMVNTLNDLVDAVKELTEAVRTFPAASEITKWKAEQYDSYKNAMKEPPKTIAKAGG